MVSAQLDYFEKKKLDVMFVTTSLIEGVNTSVENIMIYEIKKGRSKLDYFDYLNIKGRAGRRKKYFTGEVYVFDEISDIENFKIDVPFTDQEEYI